jgi:uncharacterized protein (TIGR02147 family)
VSSLTVCIREATLAELKAKIRRFREEMLDRCDSDGEPERVYQLCIQLFPMSKKREPAGPSKKGRASSLPPRRRG